MIQNIERMSESTQALNYIKDEHAFYVLLKTTFICRWRMKEGHAVVGRAKPRFTVQAKWLERIFRSDINQMVPFGPFTIYVRLVKTWKTVKIFVLFFANHFTLSQLQFRRASRHLRSCVPSALVSREAVQLARINWYRFSRIYFAHLFWTVTYPSRYAKPEWW